MTKHTKFYSTLILVLILFSYFIFQGTHAIQSDLEDKRITMFDSEFSRLIWPNAFNGNKTINSENWFDQTQLSHGGN
jgi:hypothetical protein